MNKKIIIIILFVTVIVRLYHILSPVGGWHSWRQADTAAIARNFYDSGNNILYPQIDWRGTTQGYVESEFHIYPYFISTIYNIFGVYDYFGRIISVIFSVFSVFGLYLIVRKTISERTALWAAFIFSILPLNIYFTRVFMPESSMLMCSIFGIYFFLRWIEEDKLIHYLFAIVFVSLACLIKLPTLYIGLPLAFLAFNKFRWKMFIQWKIIVMVIIVFAFVFLWYYHAHQLLKQTGLSFSIWNVGEDKWGMIGILLKPNFYNDIFIRTIGERHLTYAGFVIFVWGLFIKREYSYEMLFDYYLVSVIIFILIAPQAHQAQEYYQLPFNIPASVFIAKVFSKYISFKEYKVRFLSNKLALSVVTLALILIPVLSFLRMANFMKSENSDSPIYKLSSEVRNTIPKNDLIVTVSNGNPVYLYLSERKGWTAFTGIISKEYIEKIKSEGADYIIGEKPDFKDCPDKLDIILKNNENIINNEKYFIVKL